MFDEEPIDVENTLNNMLFLAASADLKQEGIIIDCELFSRVNRLTESHAETLAYLRFRDKMLSGSLTD